MTETLRAKPDGTEIGLLLGGIAAVVVAYFLPAVTFSGQGSASFGLSIFSKLPIMTAIAFAAMAAAVATRISGANANGSRARREPPLIIFPSFFFMC